MLVVQNLTMSTGLEALGIIEVQAILYLSIEKKRTLLEAVKQHQFTPGKYFQYISQHHPSVSFMDMSYVINLGCWSTVYCKEHFPSRKLLCSRR